MPRSLERPPPDVLCNLVDRKSQHAQRCSYACAETLRRLARMNIRCNEVGPQTVVRRGTRERLVGHRALTGSCPEDVTRVKIDSHVAAAVQVVLEPKDWAYGKRRRRQ